MKTGDFEDSIFFRVGCSCDDPDHDTSIEVCYDEQCNLLSLNFFKKFDVGNWSLKRVLKLFWDLITKKPTILYEEMIFADEKHIKDFIKAIEEGLEKVQNASNRHINK